MSAPPAHPRRVVVVLAAAVLAVSTAGTLVRLAPGTHPLALAFWRTAIVALLLLPGARPLARRDAGWIALAGGLLALHFWAWFVSLGLTTVVRSTVLVCLTPVWVGLLEWLWLGDPPRRRYWLGVAVSLGGVGVMSAVAAGPGARVSLWGDALAVLGGLLGAVYLVVGRVVRARVGIGTYGPAVCGACALTIGALALATGAPLAPAAPSHWLPILALAFGPQLLGHIGFNYAVGHVSAAVVAAVILLEPVGAGLVAALALGEIPTGIEAVGAALVLGGVGLAVVRRAPAT